MCVAARFRGSPYAGVGSCIGALFLASRLDAAAIELNVPRYAFIAGAAVLAFSFINRFWLAVPEVMLLSFCIINVGSASNYP